MRPSLLFALLALSACAPEEPHRTPGLYLIACEAGLTTYRYANVARYETKDGQLLFLDRRGKRRAFPIATCRVLEQ